MLVVHGAPDPQAPFFPGGLKRSLFPRVAVHGTRVPEEDLLHLGGVIDVHPASLRDVQRVLGLATAATSAGQGRGGGNEGV